jgi:AcrR family transcriptional regulator
MAIDRRPAPAGRTPAQPGRPAPRRSARGRPRDPAVDRRILDTAVRLLAEGRFLQLSLDDIACEAGVTKPAIYRRFPNKEAIAIAALGERRRTRPAPATGDLRRDLLAQLNDLRDRVLPAGGMALTGVVMAAEKHHPEWLRAFREGVTRSRRDQLRARLHAAVRAGEIRPDADVEACVHMLIGYWYSVYLNLSPIPDGWAEACVDILLAYLRPH